MKHIRHQRRLPGGPREALPSCVEERIWKEVDRTARRFNCSRSFVVATALADALGIDLEPVDRYDSKLTLVDKRKAG